MEIYEKYHNDNNYLSIYFFILFNAVGDFMSELDFFKFIQTMEKEVYGITPFFEEEEIDECV